MASRRRITRGDDHEFVPTYLPTRVLSRGIPTPDDDHLQLLKRECHGSPIAAFTTWDDARRWLGKAGIWGEEADAVLRPLLVAFKRDGDEAWYRALLFLLWPSLDRVSRHLRWLDEDANILDSQVHWALWRALHRLDLDRRPERLGQKLLNDVQCDVRRHYERERALCQRTQPFSRDDEDDASEDLSETLGDVDPAFERADGQHDVRWARIYLKDLVRCGRLSSADYLILVGCRLYGRSLRETADRLGLGYAATRKREQRALKYLREISRKLSHEEGRRPLNRV